MQFKEAIYGNYVKHHTAQLYGQETRDSIRAAFPVWKYYFGKLLPLEKTAQILDIGCGKGSFVAFLQEMGYTNAGGIDLSAEQIEYGKSIGITHIECADLHKYLSDKTADYDCIIARDVMEHLTRQEVFDAFLTIQKALKPGGSFILQSPNGEGIFYTSIFFGDFTHEIAFTASSLSQISLNTGFSAVACYPTGPAPLGIFSWVRYVLWKIVVWKIRFVKMIETGDGSGIFTQNLIAKVTKA
jgi:2-polyprenyl-3-methyl-5-hydroxy-6-metoxy-1,4-benzoquinol methylase